jgi:hypothetical protein
MLPFFTYFLCSLIWVLKKLSISLEEPTEWIARNKGQSCCMVDSVCILLRSSTLLLPAHNKKRHLFRCLAVARQRPGSGIFSYGRVEHEAFSRCFSCCFTKMIPTSRRRARGFSSEAYSRSFLYELISKYS